MEADMQTETALVSTISSVTVDEMSTLQATEGDVDADMQTESALVSTVSSATVDEMSTPPAREEPSLKPAADFFHQGQDRVYGGVSSFDTWCPGLLVLHISFLLLDDISASGCVFSPGYPAYMLENHSDSSPFLFNLEELCCATFLCVDSTIQEASPQVPEIYWYREFELNLLITSLGECRADLTLLLR
ncbi:hypothetical protein THAOC_36552 [Thalassiosira oceanica]|uniref:Uncharacterized protein n=1 Tax=Thalassiosira oceanica TaxID=159749 RepID=K0R004_THAOC|nr:hypothetical protein THAOC_36552 [Thalassiosira oceanica]|eukprot:EJK44875.1 hypothetical protein THAOC_36552 [Thalassiosira oceanica]